MYHPMPGCDQAAILARQPAQQRGKRILVVGAICEILVDQRRSAPVFCREMHAVADALALAVTQETLPTRLHMAWEE